jgi:propanediol dehydratase large subunit
MNAEDIDDFLAIQRDWGVDGGLRTATAENIGELRRRAVAAVRAVYSWFGLAEFTDEHAERAIDAAGSKDLGDTDTMAVLNAARTIRDSGMTGIDIVTALYESGFQTEAERVLDMLKARVDGDHLHTAAIFDEQMNVLSLVTDPNDYRGPGTGYDLSGERAVEIDAIRQQRSVADLLDDQAEAADPDAFTSSGTAAAGHDPREVVIGLSPAAGRAIWTTLSGLPITVVLQEILAGLEEEGCLGRVVRINDTIDVGRIGLTAARLSGSGIGIGLQGKGTALIHRRDLPPLANLELYSVAPNITRELYRLLGINAARHALGATPDPARNPYSDEAIEARYHTKVVSFVAIERRCEQPGGAPEQLELKGVS